MCLVVKFTLNFSSFNQPPYTKRACCYRFYMTSKFVYFCRYYANQKKTLEVNPRHPLVKELLKRVETDKEDKTAKDLARVLFETATLRSGFMIKVRKRLNI